MLYSKSQGIKRTAVEGAVAQARVVRWKFIVPAIGGGLVSLWIALIIASVGLGQNPLTFPSNLEAFQRLATSMVTGTSSNNAGSDSSSNSPFTKSTAGVIAGNDSQPVAYNNMSPSASWTNASWQGSNQTSTSNEVETTQPASGGQGSNSDGNNWPPSSVDPNQPTTVTDSDNAGNESGGGNTDGDNTVVVQPVETPPTVDPIIDPVINVIDPITTPVQMMVDSTVNTTADSTYIVASGLL